MSYPSPGREELTEGDWEEAWAAFHHREEMMMTDPTTDRTEARFRTALLLSHQANRLLDLIEMMKGHGDEEAVKILTTASTALVQAQAKIGRL